MCLTMCGVSLCVCLCVCTCMQRHHGTGVEVREGFPESFVPFHFYLGSWDQTQVSNSEGLAQRGQSHLSSLYNTEFKK